MAEIRGAALTVGEAAVLHRLEQHVEHVGVRLLDLVEQHDLVRLAADALGQGATVVIADIARRRADHPRHGVPLHVFRHVEPGDGVLVVEQELGRAFRQLGLADTGGAEEEERSSRPRAGSLSPARARRTAFDTARTASFWPTTRFARFSSMSLRRWRSASSMRSTGMPVHLVTTAATSRPVTSSRSVEARASASASRCSRSGMIE